MIFLPVMLTVAVTAPDVVRVLFGTKWDGAIPVVRILAPVGALLSIQALADSVLQADWSYADLHADARTVVLCQHCCVLCWGAMGLTGMAAAVLISTLAFLLLYVGIVARVAETSAWRFGVHS